MTEWSNDIYMYTLKSCPSSLIRYTFYLLPYKTKAWDDGVAPSVNMHKHKNEISYLKTFLPGSLDLIFTTS